MKNNAQTGARQEHEERAIMPESPNATSIHGSLAASRPTLPIRRILVPMDFSEQAKTALRYAGSFAENSGASLFVIHVIESPQALPDMPPGPQEDVERTVIDQLAAVARKEVSPFVPVNPMVRTGKAHQEIVHVAKDFGVDMIIISTHGFTGMKHIFVGSTAERVVRYAPCPVLVVRDDPAKKKLERILVAIDFSEHSRKALHQAVGLAEGSGALLTLFHVIDVYHGPEDGDLPPQAVEERLRAQSAEQLKLWAEREIPKSLRVNTEIRLGQSVYEIVTAAQDFKSDLIVLGTHGRSGLKRFLVGSTAERVVRYASCAVLTVRPIEISA